MKKLLSIILAFVLIFVFVACGKKLPEGFDQKLYDYAEAAYELVHDYNLGKIDKDSAKQRAETIEKNVSSLPVPQNNTKYSDETFKLMYETKKMSVSLSMDSFAWKIVSGGSTADIEERLKKIIEK